MRVRYFRQISHLLIFLLGRSACIDEFPLDPLAESRGKTLDGRELDVGPSRLESRDLGLRCAHERRRLRLRETRARTRFGERSQQGTALARGLD